MSSLQLASVAAQAVLRPTCSQTLETGFLMMGLKLEKAVREVFADN